MSVPGVGGVPVSDSGRLPGGGHRYTEIVRFHKSGFTCYSPKSGRVLGGLDHRLRSKPTYGGVTNLLLFPLS